ncbi:MAG: acyl-CoA dehydrogenase family protein [Pseudomonadota bacterium]
MLLNENQSLIQATVRDFAKRRLQPRSAEWDRSGHFPAEEIKTAGSLGLCGMTVPVDDGGAGADTLSYAIAIEELAAGDGSVSTIISVTNLVSRILARFGSPTQRSEELIALATGEALGCFCLTEPHAGSDASAIRTRAVRDGDFYVLNGTKQFVTSGRNADLAVVFAVTDPDAGKRGISAFLVPTTNDGYVVSRLEEKLGQHASDTAQITLDNCRIPASSLIGQPGEGYKVALSNLEYGRVGIAAQCVGMARSALECAIAYSRDRQSFDKPLSEHQAVAFRLADSATTLESCRLMVWHAAALQDAGLPGLKQACMAKLFASEQAEKICSAAIQVLGGYGYLKDFPVEQIYRDVRVAQIYEGTSDIQKMVICRHLFDN